MIASGRLNTPVDIQARTDSPDGMGGFTRAWATVATVWAEMWAVRGDERVAAASVQAHLSHRLRMHAWPGLSTSHRLKFGGRTFNITFINDVDMRGAEFLVDCLEIVGRDAQ